jgi:hypothetical protein
MQLTPDVGCAVLPVLSQLSPLKFEILCFAGTGSAKI